MNQTPKSDNELIAEFMGIVFGVDQYSWHPGCFEPLNVKHLAYHNNWSWLMPVVEKIGILMPHIKMPDDLEALKNGTHGSEQHVEVLSLSIGSKISEVHEAVVKFIVWHNNQPKP